MANFYLQGVLDGTGVALVNVGGKDAPMNATLTSVAAGRKIEFYSEPNNPWTPVLDSNTTPMINVVSMAGLLYIKFTGNPGDTWNIR